jgi:hypothetical protein
MVQLDEEGAYLSRIKLRTNKVDDLNLHHSLISSIELEPLYLLPRPQPTGQFLVLARESLGSRSLSDLRRLPSTTDATALT